MKPFTYERATSVADALRRTAGATQDGASAAYLAGGTNLVDHLRLGIREADRLIDVSHLDLTEVTELDDGTVRIGALARNADVAAHPLVRRRFPVVSAAMLAGASGQLRNMATMGGNLLQRTRCVYFQDLSTPCNKREPGSGCSAIEGFGTYNALIGASDACVAVHPSDLCVALAALDVTVVVEGPLGERRIDFGDLHRLPGDRPDQDTTLERSELITALEIAGPGFADRSRYRKLRERASYAFATVSVAAALDVRDGQIDDVRIGLGGVAHKPYRARRAEDALRGGPATHEAYAAAIATELEQARPGPDNAYKILQLQRAVPAVLDALTEAA
ncbi:Periplasmic aromatic aldehyde oxidoreductase, FAD binding subunit YagS [Serinicoccus hydrothermalis]|uniref:Periplasmic aromatic aldehyde oxidoreductase, FAD binding subunit YagS n=1 Tax=Serinicoccus hydrothermalis TaxID=1758689 RepID=A0A1B1NDB0_9MICO|nr:xanthine dehydrogenase family protein subunit M [Serinicoccus hydrothermalis]ANS79427.1 Periplasmic aromatic aldehyde oxidoreductase, FAD binding subunit YagS [Serinicoccus hydrothermalis]